jgi:hypothetical protein
MAAGASLRKAKLSRQRRGLLIAPATWWNVAGLIHLSVKREFDAEQVSRALVFAKIAPRDPIYHRRD